MSKSVWNSRLLLGTTDGYVPLGLLLDAANDRLNAYLKEGDGERLNTLGRVIYKALQNASDKLNSEIGYDRHGAEVYIGGRVVEAWREQVALFAKSYRAAQPDPQTISGIKRSLLILERDWELFIYRILLDPASDAIRDQLNIEKLLRTAAWSPMLSHHSLFPIVYDYRTEGQVFDAHGFVQKQTKALAAWQRRWQAALRALADYFQDLGPQVRAVPVETFYVGPLRIQILGAERQRLPKDLTEVAARLRLNVRRLKELGIERAVEGLTVELAGGNPDPTLYNLGGLIAGFYAHNTDRMVLLPLGMPSRHDDTTFIHELGHRVYYRFLPSGARAAWDAAIEAKTIPVTEAHIAGFADMIRMFQGKYNRMPYSDEQEKVMAMVPQLQEDAALRAVYAHLWDRRPSYDGSNSPEGYSAHYHKYLVDEAADRREQVHEETITDYATTNPQEAFAEAFVLYVLHGPSRLGPWTRATFREVLRSAFGRTLRKNPDGFLNLAGG